MEKWKVVDQSEIDDCYQDIEKLGLNKEDFTFGDEEDLTEYSESESSIGVLKGTILASRLSTEKSKRYDTGNGKLWGYNFIEDVKKGVFD